MTVRIPNTVCTHKNCKRKAFGKVGDYGIVLCGGPCSKKELYENPYGNKALYFKFEEGVMTADLTSEKPTNPLCNRKIHWECIRDPATGESKFASLEDCLQDAEDAETFDWYCDACQKKKKEKEPRVTTN